ncbi:response regulator transcription factor [Inquilinus sp. KBS0705]|nr:response regulator transcription factor [Inquilinus sp. KBS0705]
MIKVLIADDHPVVRCGLRQLLEQDFVVMGEAANGREALDLLINGLDVNVVLADVSMPVMDGLQLAQAVQENFDNLPLVLLTMRDEESIVQQAFDNGVITFLFKTADTQELIFALKQAALGKPYICSELADRMIKRSGTLAKLRQSAREITTDIDFSKRELEVLELIADGYTNEQAADKLFTSRRTVEGHRQAMLDKTGCRNSLALVRFAMRNGLLT